MDAGTILITIIENFINILPRRTIYEWEQGFKTRRGKIKRALKPGAYWFWPILERIEKETVTDTVVDTSRQDLTTEDGRIVCVSATLTYKISNIEDYYRNLQEHSDSILNLAEQAIASEVGRLSYEDLCKQHIKQSREKSSALEKKLLDGIGKSSGDYGIEVKSIGLVNFAAVQTYRIISNGNGGIGG